MRYPIFFILSGLSVFALFGCNHGSVGGVNPNLTSGGQIAWLETFVGYHGDEVLVSEFSGDIYASPIPSITSYSFNDSVFHNYTIDRGAAAFYEKRSDFSLSPAVSNIQVITSDGTLSATLSRPDTITTFSTNIIDTLRIDSAVTAHWTGGHCDFYVCSIHYEYYDVLGTLRHYYLDSIVTGNSITFPGTIFGYNGTLYFDQVASVNGPVPRLGAPGNLNGQGAGYYFNGNWSKRLFLSYPVGLGLHSATTGIAPNPAHERFWKSLPQRFGFGTMAIHSSPLNNGISETSSTSQLVFATAWIYNSSSGSNNCNFYGNVFGVPMPTLQYIQLNESAYYQSGNSSYGWFRNGMGVIQLHVNLNSPTMTVRVATSLGIATATSLLPDTITSITYTPSDTVRLGSPITISWSGGHADFYHINCEMYYPDTSVQYTYLDTLVAGDSLTINGAQFNRNGRVNIYGPTPVNGPLPRVGAFGNVTGNGAGFFYYWNELRDDAKMIYVGNGFAGSARIPPPLYKREHFLNSIKKALGVENGAANVTE